MLIFSESGFHVDIFRFMFRVPTAKTLRPRVKVSKGIIFFSLKFRNNNIETSFNHCHGNNIIISVVKNAKRLYSHENF